MRGRGVLCAVRLAVLVGGIAIWLFGLPGRAAAQSPQDLYNAQCLSGATDCDVEGYAAILASTSSGEIDTWVWTRIIPSLLADYAAHVDAVLLDNNKVPIDGQSIDDNGGSGMVQIRMHDPISLPETYELDGMHQAIDKDENDPLKAPNTKVTLYAGPPHVEGINPTFAYVGTSGTITITGKGLVDPFTKAVSYTVQTANTLGTGLTITGFNANSDGTQLTLQYSISKTATVGEWNINLQDRFGITATNVFNVGDPPPVIAGVNPPVWVAGQTNLPITIYGSGFGTNTPTVTILGAGIVSYSVVSTSDTSIAAQVSIASNASRGTATVQVSGSGYNSSGFVPAYSGEPSTSTFPVTVDSQSASAPIPQIKLYGQTITTTQSVVVGQEMALSATIPTLPPGYSFSAQFWTLALPQGQGVAPQGVVIGGYTNILSPAPGNSPGDGQSNRPNGGCVLLIQGENSQKGACTATTVSTTASSFTFYWVSVGSGLTSTPVTYTYTATNGSNLISNSAQALFNVAPGPTNMSMTTTPGTVQIVSGPPAFANFGIKTPAGATPGVNGIFIKLLATPPPGNAGAYSWVQLINSDHISLDATTAATPLSSGPHQCVPATFKNDSSPELDPGVNGYQYPSNAIPGGSVTNDSPREGLVPTLFGEEARGFSVTTFAIWTPNPITSPNCPNGSACTIPIPLGSVSWQYASDAINTLRPQSNATWTLNDGFRVPAAATNQFVASMPYSDQNYSYPVWTQSEISDPTTGIVPLSCK